MDKKSKSYYTGLGLMTIIMLILDHIGSSLWIGAGAFVAACFLHFLMTMGGKPDEDNK